MADGGARLDQAQTAAPDGQTTRLAAPLGQLSVGPQGQHVADPLADKTRRGQGRAVFQRPALLQHACRHAEVQHAGVQQPRAAEQVEYGDLPLARIVLDQKAHRVGALAEREIAQRIGPGVQTQPLDDHAVDLDHHQGGAIQHELPPPGRTHVLKGPDGRIGARRRQAQKPSRSLEALDRRCELARGQPHRRLEQVLSQSDFTAAPTLIG